MGKDILPLLADMLIKQDQHTEQQKITNQRLDDLTDKLDKVIDIMQEQNKSIAVSFTELKGLLMKQNELDERLRKVENVLFKAS